MDGNWKKTAPVTGQLPEEDDLSLEELEALAKEGYDVKVSSNELNSELDTLFRMEDSPELQAVYDASTGYYSYAFPNGRSFSMTAPFGSISNSPVTVETGNDVRILRFCHDNQTAVVKEAEEENKDILGFTADIEGGYAFSVSSETRDNAYYESYTGRYSFTLQGEGTKTNLSLINAPYGFEIGEVYLNGGRLEGDFGDRILLTKDGDYTFVFYPVKVAGAGNYTVSLKRDTTAPSMYFSEDIFAGEIKDTVFFKPQEEDAEVVLYRNGLRMSTVPDGISAGGDYYLEVSDPQGNTRGYNFSVSKKKSSSLSFYGLYLAGILIIFGIVYLFSRRNLKVL